MPLETLAAAMGGVSIDTVGRWLGELDEHGFIERRRRGRGPAECIFLRHPIFESNPPNCAGLQNQKKDNSATVRNQSGGDQNGDGRTDSTPQSCASDSADPRLQFRNSAVPIPQCCGSTNKEEDIQEDFHENTQGKPSDSCHDSRENRANTCQPSGDASPKKREKHPPEERQALRVAIARHFDEPVNGAGQLLTPDDDVLDGVLAALGDCTVAAYIRYLQNLSGSYRRGGRGAPRQWGWYVSVARNFAEQTPPKTPTADRCRHGLPWGTCCLPPAEFEAMTAVLDVPGPIQ